MLVEEVPLARLHPCPSNPRKNAKAIPAVAASLRRFDFQQPIVAKKNGEIIIGHTRFAAAQALKMMTVPVVWFAGDDVEAAALQIADNRTHEFSEWDDVALAGMLKALEAQGKLEGVGFDEAAIHEVMRDAERAAGPVAGMPGEDDGGPPPMKQAVTKFGEIWECGDHRIINGDSTKRETYEKLLGAERAYLMSTDPPYCVDYTGMDRPIHDGKPSGKDWSHLYNEVEIKDLGKFLDDLFLAALPFVRPEAAFYMWHAHLQQPVIAATFERHGLLLHQVLVWVKPVATFGHSYYRWKHEPCAFGWIKGNKPQHGVGQLDSVWIVDFDGKGRMVGNEHPTQKPLRLFEIPMEVHTAPGDIVLEPFSGSGSQLVAAERLKRKFRGVELQPVFVDVAVRRWMRASGGLARLQGDGRDFWTVAKERGVEVSP